MEAREEPLLEEGPAEKFRGATLQIHHDSNQCSRSPSSQGDNGDNCWVVAQLPLSASGSTIANLQHDTNPMNSLKPAVSAGADVVSPMTALIPSSQSRDFFFKEFCMIMLLLEAYCIDFNLLLYASSLYDRN